MFGTHAFYSIKLSFIVRSLPLHQNTRKKVTHSLTRRLNEPPRKEWIILSTFSNWSPSRNRVCCVSAIARTSMVQFSTYNFGTKANTQMRNNNNKLENNNEWIFLWLWRRHYTKQFHTRRHIEIPLHVVVVVFLFIIILHLCLMCTLFGVRCAVSVVRAGTHTTKYGCDDGGVSTIRRVARWRRRAHMSSSSSTHCVQLAFTHVVWNWSGR